MDVSVCSTSDARLFLKSVKHWLDQDEAGNNTLLSIANQAGTPGSLLRPPFWFAYSSDSDGCFGIAVFALPDGLVLSDMPLSHCATVVEELLNTGITPKRIYASKQLALIAAALISKVSGRPFRLRKQWRALQISRFIHDYSCAKGRLQRTSGADIETIIELGNQYDSENPSVVRASDYFRSRLDEGDLYIWVSERSSEVCSILALSGRTDRVIRIAGVFTPEVHRGNGYASSSIVRVTNDSLSHGYRCVTLVVDTADNTAVDIYSRLGFEPIHDRLELVMD